MEKPCKIPVTTFKNFSWVEENETGFVTKGKRLIFSSIFFCKEKLSIVVGSGEDALFASLAETTGPEVMH